VLSAKAAKAGIVPVDAQPALEGEEY